MDMAGHRIVPAAMGFPVGDSDGRSALPGSNAPDARGAGLEKGVLNLLSAGVVVIDPWGVIVFMNRSAESLLGIAAIQIEGKHVEDLPLKSFAYRVLSENTRDDSTHLSGNGKYIWVRTRVLGDRTGYYEVVEIHDRSDERKRMKSREESVAMMTHDLKSPLTVMMGYIQALRSGCSASIAAACLDELDRGARRMLSMVEDMLDAYRMETGLIQSTRGVCPIGELLLEACADYQHEAEQQGVRIEYDIPPDLPVLNADSRQLSRVFANLIGNAVKFTPAGGVISVSAERRGDTLQIRFRDTGVGIPEEDLERVFLKYYRSPRSKGYRGTGLGLAISKAFIDAHGGTIRASRCPEGGTCIDITLPLVADEETDADHDGN